jgi:SAM-dependent methyltransferase
MREIELRKPFETDYFREYYADYRRTIESLFDSERHFIEEFSRGIRTCLDIGCASGGMLEIINSLNPVAQYTGVDISTNLIAEAQRRYPASTFSVVDGVSLPFADKVFDGVVTLGTTVHDQDYRRLLFESWRVTAQKMLFDVRLTPKPGIEKLADGFVNDGSKVKYPYVVVNAQEFFDWLSKLDGLRTVRAYGYEGRANADTQLPPGYERLFMTCVLLERWPETEVPLKRPAIEWDLQIPTAVKPYAIGR